MHTHRYTYSVLSTKTSKNLTFFVSSECELKLISNIPSLSQNLPSHAHVAWFKGRTDDIRQLLRSEYTIFCLRLRIFHDAAHCKSESHRIAELNLQMIYTKSVIIFNATTRTRILHLIIRLVNL